jgi:putative DNA primase/helicase
VSAPNETTSTIGCDGNSNKCFHPLPDSRYIIGDGAKAFSDHLAQAEFMQNISPIIYDENRCFWAWEDSDKRYVMIDETDILIAIKNVTSDRLVITDKVKREIMESIRITGRERKVKDVDPNWIQFSDCVHDLTTDETFDANPDTFYTNPIPHRFGDTEDTPTVDRLLTEWVGEDYVQTMYEIMGYCMYNGYPIHRVFTLFGSGRNGKGQFMTLLTNLIGRHNTCATSLERISASRFEATKLHNKRTAFISETNFTILSKTAQLKELCGGDPIPGEYKRKTPFDFVNVAKIIVATNSLPETTDKTRGFYARWLIIRFENEFDNGVPVVDSISEWEYENLCRKCVRYLKDLLARGKFDRDGSIDERAAAYETTSSPIATFIRECCVVQGDYYEPIWTFDDAFKTWCETKSYRKMSTKEVHRWLGANYETLRNSYTQNGSQKQWKTVFGLKLRAGSYKDQ